MNTATAKQRTTNYIKQVKGSFVFKILAITISFLLIPLMIKYLGVEQYGIWSTLLSIVSWIVMFDIGIGNGLRNKISESLAKDDKQEAIHYISTSYIIIGLISVILLSIFIVTSFYVPWQSVFNTTILSNEALRHIVTITILFLFLNFWLSLINQVFNGLQKTSLVVFNQFLSNFLALISVYILYKYFETSLFKLAFMYGFSLVLSNFLLSAWFYLKNRSFIPKLKYFGQVYVKSITSLGLKFFMIQIAVIVIFTTDKILITQLFGPEYVTSYDVVFKLFSVITIFYGLIAAPLWSAYSDAFHRHDMVWIKKIILRQLKLYILIVLVTGILAILTPTIIKLWIGSEVTTDTKLVIAIAGFVLVSTWNTIFATFINAIDELTIQIYTSIIAIIINIPLSILLVQYFNFGIDGIVLGTIISLSLFAIFGSRQTYLILRGN